MKYRYLFPGMVDYPAELGAAWRSDQLPVLTVAGNAGLLRKPTMCLLSSSEIPPDLILPAFDLAVRLREAGVPVAGGFQGEVEGVCLKVLLAGGGAVVICPARSLDAISLSTRLHDRVAAGTLAYVSSERPSCRRPTVQVAMRRNDLLMGLADRLIALSAPPGSRALKNAADFLERGLPVACFDHRRNRDLLLLGAIPIPPTGPHLRPRSLRRTQTREPAPDPLHDFLAGGRRPTRHGVEDPAEGGPCALPPDLALSRAAPACR